MSGKPFKPDRPQPGDAVASGAGNEVAAAVVAQRLTELGQGDNGQSFGNLGDGIAETSGQRDERDRLSHASAGRPGSQKIRRVTLWDGRVFLSSGADSDITQRQSLVY